MSVICEGVRDERAGGRAAARTDRDAVRLGEVDEVPDDQEVVGEPHLLDRLELVLQALRQLGGQLPVALLQAFLAQLDEVVEAVATLGDVEVRQQDPAELDLDVAALGDLERAPHRVLVAGEVERHLFRRLEIEVVGLELPVVRVLQRVARLDAEQRLVGARVGVAEVVDVAGRDGRQLQLLRRARRAAAGCAPARRGARSAARRRCCRGRTYLARRSSSASASAGAVLLERLAHAPGQAAGERDQALRVALEQLPVDARLVVVALEVAERARA